MDLENLQTILARLHGEGVGKYPSKALVVDVNGNRVQVKYASTSIASHVTSLAKLLTTEPPTVGHPSDTEIFNCIRAWHGPEAALKAILTIYADKLYAYIAAAEKLLWHYVPPGT